MALPLEERLARIRAASAEKVPAEAQAVMKAAIDALVTAGAAEGALGVGEPFPALTLDDEAGVPVDLAERWARGPLVVTFFRGHW